MARVILACATLKRELNTVMEKLRCTDPVIWLEAGDHNQPLKRKMAIEAALESCPEYDTVILAMSFCGGALTGVDSGDKTLLLPCFDDCIGLLLDCPRQPDTYYLTDGWLAGERNILAEYRNSLDRHGEEKTRRIFGAMLRGYRALGWVDWGCGSALGQSQAEEAAGLLGLEFTVIPGTLSILEDLIRERECRHILRIPPHRTITLALRKGMVPVTLPEQGKTLFALPGENLLNVLRRYGLAPDAPCGGQGTCRKCTVYLDGNPQKACSITVNEPMSVQVPKPEKLRVLHEAAAGSTICGRAVAAVDLGTTSLVCSLLDSETGLRIAVRTSANPQCGYGADVVSRIREALDGRTQILARLIRQAVDELLVDCCRDAGILPEAVEKVCIVGNPAMEQLFLDIPPENLVEIPFQPVLTEPKILPCGDYLNGPSHAELLVVPNISGYVGGDTVGCILSEKLDQADQMTLLVDIGTNGEMVLSAHNRMIACATAAGPALEGANIRFGMRASPGAIDHVWLENEQVRYSTIDGTKAVGICGSGLIDAMAVFLELGKINARGRIAPGQEIDGQRVLSISEEVYLTQEDIRQVQLAKGAIHAGIRMMMEHLGITEEEIECCLLAGAFGSYLDPESACRVGLLPPALRGKIRAVGNAAARGAEQMVLDSCLFSKSAGIVQNTEVLELASLPGFSRTYGRSMNF